MVGLLLAVPWPVSVTVFIVLLFASLIAVSLHFVLVCLRSMLSVGTHCIIRLAGQAVFVLATDLGVFVILRFAETAAVILGTVAYSVVASCPYCGASLARTH